MEVPTPGRIRQDDGQAGEQRPRQGSVDHDGLRPAARRPACATRQIGKYIVPIVPDESRTFGMEGLFRQFGIYAHAGQLYEPVDSDQLAFYQEAKDGQILEEGITEAGSMSSFIAAGTAYSTHGVNMIPIFIYYSMFGFQRIGDLIWAAADARAKGFMLGGTAGRTTLNGEGLQHQDGHSLLNAIAFPTVRAYDPAFAYETTVIILDGMKRMYEDSETRSTTSRSHNENYEMPAMPAGCEEGIIRGMYKVSSVEATGGHRVQLFGSGAILREALRGPKDSGREVPDLEQRLERHQLHELRRDAQACERWNMLHPNQAAARVATSNRCSPAHRRAVHRRRPTMCAPGRADQPLGARRPVRAGHRRLRPQRNPQPLAAALRSRRRVHHARGAVSTQEARQVRRPVRRQRRERPGNRPRKAIGTVCMQLALVLERRDHEISIRPAELGGTCHRGLHCPLGGSG